MEDDVRTTTHRQPRRLRLTVKPLVGTSVVLAPVHPDDTVGHSKSRVRLALPHLPERQQRFFTVGGDRGQLGPDQDHLTLAQCGIVPAAAASGSGDRDQSGLVDSTTTTDAEEEWEDLEVRLLVVALHTCVWDQVLTTTEPATLPASSIAARRAKADVARKANGGGAGGERWFAIWPDPTKAQGDFPSVFQVTLVGFENTPYAGGQFVVDVEIPYNYPFSPPRLHMRTPIYHPTVKANGAIAVLSLTPPPPPPPPEAIKATVENGAGEGWKAEVEESGQFWAPQRSFLDVVELVHRQLRLARPWSALFGVVCGYQAEEWSGRALLERRRAVAKPPSSGLDGVDLFRRLGVLRRARPAELPPDTTEEEEEEAERERRRLVEAKARALTRFHATDGRYVWHERDHPWLPPALRRDVAVLLMVVRRQSEGLLLPEELVRLIVQELAQLHHEESKHVVWWR